MLIALRCGIPGIFWCGVRHALTLSWGTSGMYVGWGGVGKFTYPCYLLKYLSKRHQNWQFCSTSDEDQKNIHDILIFVMTSSYFIDDVIKISIFEGQQ